MPNHAHKPFQFKKFGTDLPPSALNALNLCDLIDHEKEQYQLALEADDQRSEWQTFKSFLDLCIEFLNAKDISSSSVCFYWLGYIAKSNEDLLASEAKYQALKALMEKDRSEDILKRKAWYLQQLRVTAQGHAEIIWKNDTDQKLRVSEVAIQVKEILDWSSQTHLAKMRQYIPSFNIPKIDQIKKWVRAVAPAYAKKAGRSKK